MNQVSSSSSTLFEDTFPTDSVYLQDNYLEEAFKMRNVLEELLKTHHGQRKPTILGLREHIFTGRFGLTCICI